MGCFVDLYTKLLLDDRVKQVQSNPKMEPYLEGCWVAFHINSVVDNSSCTRESSPGRSRISCLQCILGHYD